MEKPILRLNIGRDHYTEPPLSIEQQRIANANPGFTYTQIRQMTERPSPTDGTFYGQAKASLETGRQTLKGVLDQADQFTSIATEVAMAHRERHDMGNASSEETEDSTLADSIRRKVLKLILLNQPGITPEDLSRKTGISRDFAQRLLDEKDTNVFITQPTISRLEPVIGGDAVTDFRQTIRLAIQERHSQKSTATHVDEKTEEVVTGDQEGVEQATLSDEEISPLTTSTEPDTVIAGPGDGDAKIMAGPNLMLPEEFEESLNAAEAAEMAEETASDQEPDAGPTLYETLYALPVTPPEPAVTAEIIGKAVSPAPAAPAPEVPPEPETMARVMGSLEPAPAPTTAPLTAVEKILALEVLTKHRFSMETLVFLTERLARLEKPSPEEDIITQAEAIIGHRLDHDLYTFFIQYADRGEDTP